MIDAKWTSIVLLLKVASAFGTHKELCHTSLADAPIAMAADVARNLTVGANVIRTGLAFSDAVSAAFPTCSTGRFVACPTGKPVAIKALKPEEALLAALHT